MGKGWKGVILPDVHIDKNGYDPVYETAKTFIADFRPDKTFLLGDFADNEPLSHWIADNKRKVDPGSHKKEIEIVNRELDFVQRHSKEVIWLEGNHEHWTELYLDRKPEMQGFIEYPVVCNLKKRGVKWVEINKLHKASKHLYLTHGISVTEHHAKAHLHKLGVNVVYGHTHRSQVYTINMALQRSIKAFGLGCLCCKKPVFMKNKIASWDYGFAVVYVAANGEFNVYPIDIVSGRFYFNGKSYS